MKSTISKLWNGNIAPVEKLGKHNPEIHNLIGLISRNVENLEKLLNEEQKVVLEKYVCCTDEYWTLITEQAFCEGFSLGSKLLAESFAEAE